jgi:hypothetical protein
VECARKEHYSQSRCRVVVRSSDFGEAITTTTGVSCCGRYLPVAVGRHQLHLRSTRNPAPYHHLQSPVKLNNANSASTVVKNPGPSSSTGGRSTATPSSIQQVQGQGQVSSQWTQWWQCVNASTPAMTQAQTNGVATVVNVTAIVRAVHAHPNGNGPLPNDGPSRICERCSR